MKKSTRVVNKDWVYPGNEFVYCIVYVHKGIKYIFKLIFDVFKINFFLNDDFKPYESLGKEIFDFVFSWWNDGMCIFSAF